MRFLIIIDHPWEGSFNHCVLDSFISGLENTHEIDVLDLHKEHFNPVMNVDELAVYSQGKYLDPKVEEYQNRLLRTDHLVMIFPVWWMVMPAPLKGWLDKILLPGFAFTEEKEPKPLLGFIQGATILTTTALPDNDHRKKFNNALDWVLCKGTLEFCGITPVKWLNFGETGIAGREIHTAWLDTVKAYASNF